MCKGSEAKAPSGTQDVETFLASVNLQKYTSTFLENGVDDLEIILELDDKHLEQMSVPLGHKLKIMKRIKELRKDRGMAIPDSRQSTSRPVVDSLNTNDSNGARRPLAKRNDLEELPDPTGGIYTSGKVPLAQTETTDVDTTVRTEGYLGHNAKNNGGGSLLSGEYDEAQSHLQFLEALNAWRTGGSAKPAKPTAKATTVSLFTLKSLEVSKVHL